VTAATSESAAFQVSLSYIRKVNDNSDKYPAIEDKFPFLFEFPYLPLLTRTSRPTTLPSCNGELIEPASPVRSKSPWSLWIPLPRLRN